MEKHPFRQARPFSALDLIFWSSIFAGLVSLGFCTSPYFLRIIFNLFSISCIKRPF